MKNKTILILLVLVILCGGCASLSTYQKAQVLEENATQFGFALTSTDLSLIDEDEDDPFFESFNLILPELFYRVSVNSKMDFGAKVFPLSVVLDGKYQFIDGEKFDMAADLGIGYNKFAIDDKDTGILDIYPTVLMTFNLSEKVGVTLAPKLITRFLSSGGSKETITIPGGTMALSLGPLMPEIGYYTSKNANYFTFGVALNLNINP